ncbi:YqzL family protein [Paenibacillus sp. N4]|uniref:YqzL family protein n=1 Tax=Paenibacillus vietnamensis TaxID=2590547 RepID=UPI001CD17760|nr:YqzL family protein [Paenibacillus vietnamensis]MCA0754582.1 YqzL family protein [Paenibacillus vietnamensis]
MRDFSWKYFTLTGDVESFMLYKEMNQFGADNAASQAAAEEEPAGAEPDEASV